ncbi:lysoplasmalogenase [Moellerella wisconsensis]|mgnify:CR=1 FL=1|uniref:Lysoplasmalogenase n=3 Tax=Moellerella wisconsensis TaxID=158849 RepID=A0A9Q8Q266_9GAMM|nr:lysoplasmalogenase [Moellerella wisconsensis]KPD04111.1 putative membrane protein [Moellerella wisconsensis ATCC 35017]UNH24547.1 lysoplasmalogenase [Moellerella wisconsensis]UNH27652.1 lysoplasmalogenase [Moellerella wisconsensis]UNH31125.1 lysoplasmalogenase [Moellerella wisconsensis]UNH39272.1 lysoplasmalogenase [Moellerella wisconsensis]
MISWPFLAVLFSGWLYVDAAYRGPDWQRWLFRPVTLLLLLAWGWNAEFITISGYLVLAGLLASLLGDMLRILPGERLLASIALIFISYLLYAISFGLQMNFSLYLPWLPVPIVLTLVTLLIIWTKLETLQAPVFALLIMSMIMVWVAGDQYFGLAREVNFSIMVGACLLFLSNCIWLIARFRYPFKASKAIVATLYFLGQFLIIRSLYL